MWQLYAQTAIDLVRERQLDAERDFLRRYAGAYEPARANRLRRVVGGAIGVIGRGTERLGIATARLGGRVEGPLANT